MPANAWTEAEVPPTPAKTGVAPRAQAFHFAPFQYGIAELISLYGYSMSHMT